MKTAVEEPIQLWGRRHRGTVAKASLAARDLLEDAYTPRGRNVDVTRPRAVVEECPSRVLRARKHQDLEKKERTPLSGTFLVYLLEMW